MCAAANQSNAHIAKHVAFAIGHTTWKVTWVCTCTGMNWWMTCLSKNCCHAICEKSYPDKTIRNIHWKKNFIIYHRKFEKRNGLSTIPSSSPLNAALKNHGNIAELQWLLSTAKVLSQTMSLYTPAIFTLLLFISILCMATIWL